MRGLHSTLESLKENVRKFLNIYAPGKSDMVQRDLERVSIASAMLKIPEFQFFHIAYFQWFGKEIGDIPLESIFAGYIFEDRVPFWVRHLARRVISEFDQGMLDPGKYNIPPSLSSRRRKILGIVYTLLILVIMVLFIASILNTPPRF